MLIDLQYINKWLYKLKFSLQTKVNLVEFKVEESRYKNEKNDWKRYFTI